MPSPVVEQLDVRDQDTAEQVLAVQRAAYRAEADLIGSDRIPQLTESLEALQARSLDWLGVRDGANRIVAALAYTDDGATVDIDRLVVAPNSLRRGYGRALVEPGDSERTALVCTGRDNHPARALYESLGFRKTHDEEVVSGLVITHFRREAVT